MYSPGAKVFLLGDTVGSKEGKLFTWLNGMQGVEIVSWALVKYPKNQEVYDWQQYDRDLTNPNFKI